MKLSATLAIVICLTAASTSAKVDDGPKPGCTIEKAFVSFRISPLQWMPENRFEERLALFDKHKGVRPAVAGQDQGAVPRVAPPRSNARGAGGGRSPKCAAKCWPLCGERPCVRELKTWSSGSEIKAMSISRFWTRRASSRPTTARASNPLPRGLTARSPKELGEKTLPKRALYHLLGA